MNTSEGDHLAEDRANTEKIKRRLKRKQGWEYNILDALVENRLRLIGNDLANRGPRAQCMWLLDQGVSYKEIIEEGRRVRRHIKSHYANLVPVTGHRRMKP